MYLGCRRGTEFSRTADGIDLSTKEGEQQYFDYNTETVGREDIRAMVQRINEVYNEGRTLKCEFTQILTHGLGTAEVAAALANNGDLINLNGDPVST